MKLLFLDTETTGLDPQKHGVSQIAGIIEVDGVIQEEFNFFVRPLDGQVIDPKALAVTGKTEDDLVKYPEAAITFTRLRNILCKYVDPYNKRSRFTIVGQNIAFDYAMMEAFFKKCGDHYWYSFVDFRGLDIITCTALFQAAGHFQLPNLKLSTVAAHFGIPLDSHDAMNDIRATREIYHKYVSLIASIKGNIRP